MEMEVEPLPENFNAWKVDILDKDKTEIVAACHPHYLLALLHRNRDADPLKVTVALSKLVWNYPIALRFAEEFCVKLGSPLALIDLRFLQLQISEEPERKRAKKFNSSSVFPEDFVDLLKSILILVKKLPSYVYSDWDLQDFLSLKNSKDNHIKWLAVNLLAVILHLSDGETIDIKRLWSISEENDKVFGLQLQTELELRTQNVHPVGKDVGTIKPGIVRLASDLISVDGALLKSSGHSQENQSSKIVPLQSTMKCIKEIVLHVSSQFVPICILGPISCGKSALLQYSASLFGRNSYPKFVSVQMSDQIDSRLLLGSYHSTDLPGQFVWKAGCLTTAVLNGYWILLEDLDLASLDVIAILNYMIDTKHLSVPGYGEINQYHPNFRLFATSRLYEKGGRRISEKIGNQWKKIYLNTIPNEEVKFLVDGLYPNLKPILNRLMEIYSAMVKHDSNSRLSSSNRIVSLRDFLKLCRRIPHDLDFSSTDSAIHIFQDAYDIFVTSSSCPTVKQAVASILGSHLGLLQAKIDYFCTMYKPHINVCNQSNTLTSGRKSLHMYKPLPNLNRDELGVYSLTKRACCLMEMICGSVVNKEPILLIGETGVGKTSCIQYLAKILHQKLVVVNLNRQSDSGDLLGGYKPVELKYIFAPLREEFEYLFGQTFNKDANTTFIGHIMTCFANRKWKDLIKLLAHGVKLAPRHLQKLKNTELSERWTTLGHQLNRLETQLYQGEESPFAFSFIEGTLIDAFKNGHWILLDEINLATPEMLQCLSGVLEENAQLHLWEKGDDSPIAKHKNFHLFAAMNPSTDVGKKDLPVGLRNRFTEVYVEELTDSDEIRLLVSDYLRDLSLASSQIDNIVQFYLKIKQLSLTTLVDGMGKKPHFSLRTLCRALKISALNLYGSVSRSLYESFCLSFLTQLDYASHPVVQNLVAKYVYGKTEVRGLINQPLPAPTKGNFVKIEGYWIPQGSQEPNSSSSYILTTSVRRNLKDLARIVSAGKLPILIQGETSVGKTSLIKYLAEISGNKCYRINNHQHTDLQEYVGSYQSDAIGKLVFTEGVLLQAMRRGEWIILDELNLAPSEVLEALNRLLDDNRQLFVTETGQTVSAHPRFMLFATQNPPGLYGGRKLLSRAFRNRFVELHFDEIPSAELENILHLRCAIPKSYCGKIIGVMKDLQTRRKASAALQGKHGFATLRDLFRWAERYRLSGQQETKFYDWDQHLADEGYLVLAGKVRKPGETEVILEVLHKHLKRNVNPQDLFSLHEKTSLVTKRILEAVVQSTISEFKHIVWTFQMRRLAVLIGKALEFKEPVLLVGETGLGKTTIVQLLCHIREKKLFSVNCHMHSEGSDFIGGLRPVRDHQNQGGKLFEWVDGPLVEAMESGAFFLADEISLADDSVLERVNSVLEPERNLLIAEKGDETPRLVVAHEGFYFVGTMNPGGDYGKKELSPALRNRLTEIWCDAASEENDMISIIEHNLESHLKNKGLGQLMVSFVKWLKNNEIGYHCTASIRDFLAWTSFISLITRQERNESKLSIAAAVYHGASLVFLDGLGSGNTASENTMLSKEVQRSAATYLQSLTSNLTSDNQLIDFQLMNNHTHFGMGPFTILRNACNVKWSPDKSDFAITSPTTSQNAIRILRAMQLVKPILLEGSPGVGKTALVSALAQICGYSLVRINLSEQTDISDLFGADLPVEGGSGGQFAWRDGPLLQALKNNSWILFDELNLASQSVLEGLNACLDHRGEIFVPELNKTFKLQHDVDSRDTTTRIFGCQNPVRQGGARKGLPKSFLNRFTVVYMDPLEIIDLQFVLRSSWSSLPVKDVEVMTKFSSLLHESVCQRGLFGAKGSPWDFNLRDLMRWAQLLVSDTKKSQNPSLRGNCQFRPELFVDLVYGLRMRSAEDRRKVLQLFYSVWKDVYQTSSDKIENVIPWGQSQVLLTEDKFYCGRAVLDRIKSYYRDSGRWTLSAYQLLILQKQLPIVEAFGKCMEMCWMPILVGGSSTGKTSVVQLVAQLCGKNLKVINPSPEMDAVELLGGFEQADIYRKIDETCLKMNDMLLRLVKKWILFRPSSPDANSHDDIERTAESDPRSKDSHWTRLLELLDIRSTLKNLSHLAPKEGMGRDEEMKRIESIVDTVQTSLLRCKSFVESELANLSQHHHLGQDSSEVAVGNVSHVEIDEHEEVEEVAGELEQIYTHLKAGIQTGAFQWIDSLLIKAIKNGDWLMIDGANRCTAAVLDRLNPLMEPNGSLFLSERGCIDGKIIEIRPHPDFRLILTMDPGFGEISRAMRNRGVEIYMESGQCLKRSKENTRMSSLNDLSSDSHLDISPSNGLEDSHSNILCRVLGWTDADVDLALVSEFGINSFDLDALLRAEGLQDPRLRAALVNLHLEARNTVASQKGHSGRLGVFELILCARSMKLQMQSGVDLLEAFNNAYLSSYFRSSDDVDVDLKRRIETLLMSFSCQLKGAKMVMTSRGNSCRPSSRLTLCPRNFFSSQLYRIWNHLEVLRESYASFSSEENGITSVIFEKLSTGLGNIGLFQDCVLISVFSRVLPQDASFLASAVAKEYPEKFSSVIKIAKILEAHGQDFASVPENYQWDVQWVPHLFKKENRTNDYMGDKGENQRENSLWADYLALVARVYLLLVDSCNTIEVVRLKHTSIDTKKKSFGFAAKNSRFSQGVNTNMIEFLAGIWNLVSSLDSFIQANLSRNFQVVPLVTDMEGDDPAKSLAESWRKGISTFLWRKRLWDFMQIDFDCRRPGEKIVANATLLVKWVGENASQFLNEISCTNRGTDLRNITENCLRAMDYCGDHVLLEHNAILRQCSGRKPFAELEAERISILSTFMEVCFGIWSLTSVVPTQKLISFLYSDSGKQCQQILSDIYKGIVNGEAINSTDTNKFLNDVKEKLTKLKESVSANECTDVSVNEGDDYLTSLCSLEEYLRVSLRKESGVRVSAFVNPLLWGHGSTKDSLINYLEWEDVEKFRHLFVDIPVYLIENACLLPYFCTKVLLEKDRESFRNSSLGSRESSQSCLTKVNILLSSEMMRRRDDKSSLSYPSLLNGFLKQFRVELEKWNQNEKLRGCLVKCIEKIDDVFNNVVSCASIQDEREISRVAFDLGSSIVQSGGVLIKISSDLPVVDPAVEKQILSVYLNEEIEFFNTWLTSQRIHQLILTGVDICQKDIDSLHPYIFESGNHLKELRSRLQEAQTCIAIRPEPPEYDSIRKDIKQFSMTLGSAEKLEELVLNVKRVLTIISLEKDERNSLITQDDINSALIPCLNWIDAQKNFSKKLVKNFWYWDINAGFLAATSQAALGLNILCDVLRRVKLTPTSSMKSRIHQLVTFPIPYKSQVFNLSGLHTESWAEDSSAKKVFMASILSFMNEVDTQGRLNSEIVLRLHNLSQEIFQLWKTQEEEKARQKELEEALYIHKGKEKSMELSEEAQELQDIQNYFPDFGNEFKDFQEVNCLMDGEGINLLAENQNSQSYSGELKPDDIALFLSVHSRVIQLVKNHWISETVELNANLDFVTPFMNQFEEGCLAYQKHASTLDREDETYFIIGANVAVRRMNVEPEMPNMLVTRGKLYDFYHDSNISEVQKLNSIFEGLEKRVRELLQEWPDHPSLFRILEVVSRIESFKMDGPVMKFLTGLEMLLGVAQEWERCAHRGVTLSIHLSEVTNLIISWRKLELKCWKNLLDINYQKEQAATHRWWFHLYSAVMEAYLSPQLVTSNPSDFLETLHRFIESSSLGQFHTRLNLLRSIHCHIIALEQYAPQYENNPTELLHPYIWNTFCYYRQFSEVVHTKCASLRQSIEKKMKDFVKISRWNDANYYSLKASVLKSQKMLNKLVREYKKALAVPVTTVLVAEVGTDSPYWEKKKSKMKRPKQGLYVMPENWKEKCLLSKNQVKDGIVNENSTKRLKKLSKLFGKMREVTSYVTQRDGHSIFEDTSNLDELTGSIIQRVHELQALEVTETAKEKRKKALHHVHNMRRTTLADLFKTLQKLNLSYRRGMIHMKNFETNSKVMHDFKTEPMNLEAGWKLLKEKNEKFPADVELIQSWEGCENYFQKSVARLATLVKAFQNPSKELGPNIVARCKGFVADLMSVVSDQKVLIGKFSKFIWALRSLTDLSDNVIENFQEELSLWMEKFYDQACATEFSVKQYVIIVDSLQQPFTEVSTTCKAHLSSILMKCDEIKLFLRKSVDNIPVLGYQSFIGDRDILVECRSLFMGIYQDFVHLQNVCEPNSVLRVDFEKMDETVKKFLNDAPNFETTEIYGSTFEESDAEAKDFYIAFTHLLENILVTFQKLNKLGESDILEVVGEDDRAEASKRFIVSQTICFKLNEVLGGVLKVKTMLGNVRGRTANCLSIFKGMLPLLKQYSMTAQFYLTHFVQYHRASCKLLSVLCAVFSTLGQKGFCLPSDYENDAMEEGPEIDQESGMGLGEGDTSSQAQDVSDRLESEDQLEDTMKEGETMESADKDLKDDTKGVEMSEDFEGKQQDKEQKPGEDEDESEKSDKEEEELDKQMGEVDDLDAENLDDQMWGGSSDEEDEDIDDKDDDKGKGKAKDKETRLAAKDSTLENDEEESDAETQDKPEKERKGKEFNEEEDDGELNDDQVDPYHGQDKPEEEPEALDIPEDINLDDGDPKDGEIPEENPFDLDKEKDDITDMPEDKEEEIKEQQEGETEEPLSEDEDPESAKGVDVEMVDLEEDEEEKKGNKEDEGLEPGEEMDIDEKNEQEPEENVTESETGKSEDKVEPSQDLEQKGKDQTSAPNEKAKSEEQIQMKMTDEENSSKNDEQAAGQAESQDGAGHEGKTAKNEKSQVAQYDETEKDASRKPGETDSKRSLADEKNLVDKEHKRRKTVDNPDKSEEKSQAEDNVEEDNNDSETNAELYQHIKSAEKSDSVTVDNATTEQSEQQKMDSNNENKDEGEQPKLDDSPEEMEEDKEEVEEIEEMSIDKERPDLIRGLPQDKKKPKKPSDVKEDKQDEEMFEVEGEKVLTYGAQRPSESVVHTRLDLLDEWKKQKEREEIESEAKLMEFTQTYLTPSEESAALTQWHELEGKTFYLAQELCEQLRLILEPTLAARLKGDYKTGKRLNMRKVIPYIASGFRKDKIWLRRTQPSKREYQILIALDDSASMADNQSKQMAFSAVAVVARSLGLLEAGQLGVLSFGEEVKLMHPFEDPFTDFSGARLLKQFTFVQRRTRIAQLLESSLSLFSSAKASGSSNIHPDVAQLLLIISDGRGVCHEGSETVKKAIKKAREQNIFIVFVIVDNPVNKDSILDIRLPIFGPNNTVDISKYMDHFPFPFYLILRELNALPSVLSDALRQWFELVTSSER